MNDPAAWRSRANDALEAYFRRRSFPRLMLSLLLLLTGVTGFLVSYGMLRLGLDHMWLRYPIAALVGYGVLLALIRVWVEIERSGFDPAEAGIEGAGPRSESGLSLQFRPARNSWFDWLDVADFSADVIGEGCLPAVLFAVVLVLLGIILSTIAAAPALIAEVFLDAFIVTLLYRHLRIAQKEHWLGTALRKTWSAALFTAAALALGGWALEQMAPGARSIGQAGGPAADVKLCAAPHRREPARQVTRRRIPPGRQGG